MADVLEVGVGATCGMAREGGMGEDEGGIVLSELSDFRLRGARRGAPLPCLGGKLGKLWKGRGSLWRLG